MNYIYELNAFYDFLLYNPMPTSSIVLYQALLQMNSKARWIKEFTVANIVLKSLTGLDISTINRARNNLKQKGLIDFKKGNINVAPKYIIFGLYNANSHANNDANKSANNDANNDANINKQKETKENNNNPPISPQEGGKEEKNKKLPSRDEMYMDLWNALPLGTKITSIKNKRRDNLSARLRDHGAESFEQAIQKIQSSSFLKGQNKNNWVITFDWLIRPNNYAKVLEGNYDDQKTSEGQGGNNDWYQSII